MPLLFGEGFPVHDCIEKRWRHLDFFQHQAFLTARVPRVRCPTWGVTLVDVPWARPRSGFALLIDAMLLEMARNMPVRAVAGILEVGDKRVWRAVTHDVMDALRRLDLSDVDAYRLIETFRDLCRQPVRTSARALSKAWVVAARRSGF